MKRLRRRRDVSLCSRFLATARTSRGADQFSKLPGALRPPPPPSRMSGQTSSCPSGGPGWLTPERNEAAPPPSTAGTPRFGALSHHSFFSRHNPHPHRVRHIQGLNGRPVCTVRDDWLVSSSLFPHPLLKSHVQRQAVAPALAWTPHRTHLASQAAMFSEAWRDELRELAAKVGPSSQAQEGEIEAQLTEEPVRRETQYSAQTGRLVPATAKSHPRRPPSQHLDHHKPFHDQELMVLELLCQILQTDSLRAVQRWLLLAGHREKELVTGMLKRVDLSGRPSRSTFWRPVPRLSTPRGGHRGEPGCHEPTEHPAAASQVGPRNLEASSSPFNFYQ